MPKPAVRIVVQLRGIDFVEFSVRNTGVDAYNGVLRYVIVLGFNQQLRNNARYLGLYIRLSFPCLTMPRNAGLETGR